MRAITLGWKRKPAYWWRIKLEFKIQDFWVGVFWKSTWNIGYESCSGPQERVTFDIWLCLVPCVPIHFAWRHIHKERRRPATKIV